MGCNRVRIQAEIFIKSTMQRYFNADIEELIFESRQTEPLDKKRVCLIFCSGLFHRLSFAVFFDDEDALALAENFFKHKVLKTESFDFMMEYCNLLMGTLKRNLDKQGLPSDVSLPLVAIPFQEQLFSAEFSEFSELCNWKVKVGGRTLKVYFQFDVFDKSKFNNFKVLNSNAIDEEIDFFK